MEGDGSQRTAQDEANPIKKKRTRRGLALRSPLKTRGNEDISIPIYNSRIDTLREEKKKKIVSAFGIQTNQFVDYDSDKEVEEVEEVTFLSENNKEKKKEDLDESQAPLSPPRYYPTEVVVGPHKRKMIKLLAKLEKAKNQFELEMVQDEMRKMESSIIDECDCLFVDTNREFFLKVRWKLKIQKISIKNNQPFNSILDRFAEMVKEPAGKLIFIFNDNLIKLTDTPSKLGITISDIIDCGLLSSESTSTTSSKDKKNSDLMTFKLQSKDMKKKIELSILKTDTMSKLIEKFAEQQKISGKNITLQFDGENLEEDKTPLELDLENDFCIDVMIR